MHHITYLLHFLLLYHKNKYYNIVIITKLYELCKNELLVLTFNTHIVLISCLHCVYRAIV